MNSILIKGGLRACFDVDDNTSYSYRTGISFGNVVTGRDETAVVTGWRCVQKMKLQKIYIIADFHQFLNLLPIFTYLAMQLTNLMHVCVYI